MIGVTSRKDSEIGAAWGRTGRGRGGAKGEREVPPAQGHVLRRDGCSSTGPSRDPHEGTVIISFPVVMKT